MKVDVSLSGTAELLQALHLIQDSPQALRARQMALAAGARVARKEARKTAAFVDRSGRLRKSIRVKNVRRGHFKGGVVLVAGGKGAAQAHLIEYGHGGRSPAPPHPFLEPAALNTRDKAFTAIAARARVELGKLAARGIKTPRRRR